MKFFFIENPVTGDFRMLSGTPRQCVLQAYSQYMMGQTGECPADDEAAYGSLVTLDTATEARLGDWHAFPASD